MVVASTVDLGMLAILIRGDEQIGILFRPNHKSIQALQLSMLSGALVRSAKTRGVFVAALAGDESAPAGASPSNWWMLCASLPI